MSPTAFYISIAWVLCCAAVAFVTMLRNERGEP